VGILGPSPIFLRRCLGNPYSQHFEGPSYLLHRRGSHHPPPLVVPPRQGTRTVPVKCPPRKTTSASGQTLAILSSPDSEDAPYLTRLYDSRTWEMYRRITEDARKGSRYSRTHSVNPPDSGQTKFAWDNLQHDDATESYYGDEMIFQFDVE
jgi:hypothetical protein